jgi:hypothetical protein
MKNKLCLKCKKEFPQTIRIDGKRRNLNNRKYCLDCSPFGSHNTRELQDNVSSINLCKRCGRHLRCKRRRYCQWCTLKRKRDSISKNVYNLLGNRCWICNECSTNDDYTNYLFCLHHVYPEYKKYKLSKDNMSRLSHYQLKEEIKKCVCLCHNCHSTFHYTDLITQNQIITVYNNFWLNIVDDDMNKLFKLYDYENIKDKNQKDLSYPEIEYYI